MRVAPVVAGGVVRPTARAIKSSIEDPAAGAPPAGREVPPADAAGADVAVAGEGVVAGVGRAAATGAGVGVAGADGAALARDPLECEVRVACGALTGAICGAAGA